MKEKSIHSSLQEKYGIIGESKPIQDALQKLIQVAPTDLTLLITGETGTGKEVFANALHGLSKRKKFPFVSVNCGAIPETLLESELFGHEKGAFTGAIDQRKGFFEVADKGTIFLDEIGEMPFSTQVKLLRVLEAGEFSRLGSSTVHKVDVRIVAATNRDLEQEVRAGNFRHDLFFRLNSVHIILPPLREHIVDIPILFEHFANKVCHKLGLKYDGISESALDILRALPWQGNVREFKNLVETVITLEQATYVTPELLRKHIAPALPPYTLNPVSSESSLIPVTAFERGNNPEFELLLRTLLELKNDIAEIKRYIHILGIKIAENKDTSNSVPIQKEQFEDFTPNFSDDLNMENVEKKMLIAALQKFKGNRRHAARALGISERTLYRKLQNYGFDTHDFSMD